MNHGLLLWFLLLLFCLRVLGQFLVVLYQPRWLPPMGQWYSGLIPYRTLLSIQIVFILLMGWMSRDVTREAGVFASLGHGAGRGVAGFSVVYFGGMVVRYVVRMARRPDQRWFGGTIPIFFHWVLALFLFVYGRFLLSR